MCGHGENCAAGSMVNTHGFLDEIKDYYLPSVEPEAYRKADVVAHRLGEIIKAKKS